MKPTLISILLLLWLSQSFGLFAQNEKIILIGDTQRTLWFELFREQNEEIRQLIFPQIASEKPQSLIILGDMTNWGASQSEWEYFDSISKPIRISNIPILPVVGNHEYFGSNEKAIENLKAHFKEFTENTWYSKQIGQVGFVALNSNLDELDSKERTNQKKFLDSVLNYFENQNSIKIVIVSWHHPIYTNSTLVSDDKVVENEFMPKIRRYTKVKLIASGHCHSYEHFFENNKHFLVSGGAGGPRQTLLEKNESRQKDLYDGKTKRDFHYCILEQENSKYKIRVIAFQEETKTWKEIDNWWVE